MNKREGRFQKIVECSWWHQIARVCVRPKVCACMSEFVCACVCACVCCTCVAVTQSFSVCEMMELEMDLISRSIGELTVKSSPGTGEAFPDLQMEKNPNERECTGDHAWRLDLGFSH